MAGSLYYMTAERARLRFERGDWQRAESDALWVLGRPEEPGITRMPALATLARLHVRRGDPGVDQTIEEAWRLAEPTGELQRMGPVAAGRAELAWLRDDQDGIEPTFAETYALGLAARQPWITDELAFWVWRATGTPQPLEGPETPYALQMVGAWQKAADAWARIGCPYERAVALMDAEDPPHLFRGARNPRWARGDPPAAAKLRRQLRRSGVQGVPRGPRKETSSPPRRSHPTTGRGSRAPRRRIDEREHCRAALRLTQDRRPSCICHPDETGRFVPDRGSDDRPGSGTRLILAPPISRQTSRKAYTVKAGLGWLGLPADKATVDIDEVNVQSISSRSAKKQGSIPSRKPTASSSRTARRHSRQPDLVEPPEVRSPDPGFPTGIGSTRSWCRSSAG